METALLQLQCDIKLERQRRLLIEGSASSMNDGPQVFKVHHAAREDIMGRTEEILLAVLGSIERTGTALLMVPVTSSWDSVSYDEAKGHIELARQHKETTIELGTFRFTVIMKLLSKVYNMLRTNTQRTLRDIYYTDVPFYRAQTSVNDGFNDLCCILRVPRWSLNCVSIIKMPVET